MKYGAYVRQHIFEPAGINNTFYDIVYGYNGLFQNYFPQFGYRQIVAPARGAFDAAGRSGGG